MIFAKVIENEFNYMKYFFWLLQNEQFIFKNFLLLKRD